MKIDVSDYRELRVSTFSHKFTRAPNWVFVASLKIESALDHVYGTYYFVMDFLVPRRKVSVVVEDHDVYNTTETLAIIIVPTLIKSLENYDNYRSVDNVDLPEELRSKGQRVTEFTSDGLENPLFRKRWEWVISEITSAFSAFDDDSLSRDKPNSPRVKNGLRLFSKYFSRMT
jgi:hypothetical protein